MDFFTVAAAAKELGISTKRVSRLCKEGRLRSQKFGLRAYMIDPFSVEEYRTNPSRKHAPHEPAGGRPPGKQRKKHTKTKK